MDENNWNIDSNNDFRTLVICGSVIMCLFIVCATIVGTVRAMYPSPCPTPTIVDDGAMG